MKDIITTPQIKASHATEWARSAVAPDIVELNVRSLSGQEPYDYLFYGINERLNGGRVSTGLLRRYRHVEYGGWWCSGVDLLRGGDSQWGCFKPDRPFHDRHNKKIVKYEHPPNVPTELFALKVSDRVWEKIANKFKLKRSGEDFWKWVQGSPNLPILITEGAKKAGCLLSHGYCAVALPGIFNGYRNHEGKLSLIPQIEALCCDQREWVFAFDQESKPKTREAVTQAILTTGKLLEEYE